MARCQHASFNSPWFLPWEVEWTVCSNTLFLCLTFGRPLSYCPSIHRPFWLKGSGPENSCSIIFIIFVAFSWTFANSGISRWGNWRPTCKMWVICGFIHWCNCFSILFSISFQLQTALRSQSHQSVCHYKMFFSLSDSGQLRAYCLLCETEIAFLCCGFFFPTTFHLPFYWPSHTVYLQFFTGSSFLLLQITGGSGGEKLLCVLW